MSSIIVQSGLLPPGVGGPNTELQRSLKLSDPWLAVSGQGGVQQGPLALPGAAGASAYTNAFDVRGRDTFVVQVDGTLTGLSLVFQATLNPYDDTGPWYPVGSPITAAGITIFTGWFSLVRFNYAAITTGTPIISLVAVRN